MKKITNLLLFLLCVNVVVGQFGLPNRVSFYNLSPITTKPYDMDNDGDLDVLSSTQLLGENLIVWYENNGNGNMSTEHIITTSVLSVKAIYAADLDNDGDLDVLVASKGLVWYENYGGGVFSGANIINNNVSNITSVYAADIDNDGNIDILSSSNSKTYWHKNLGGAVFGSEEYILNNQYSIQVKDIDNDGYNDLLVNHSTLIGWVKNMNGILDTNVTPIFSSNQGVSGVIYEDIDGDGKIDVVSTSYSQDKVRWHKNLGSAIFLPEQLIANNINGASGLFVCDLDGDFDMDVITTSLIDEEINWVENLGGSSFSLKQLILSDVNTSSIYAADINLNGKMDILTAFELTTNNKKKIVWLENNLPFNFIMNTISSNTNTVYDVKSVDIDNDGNMDIVSASKNDHKVAWYKNLGGGYFNKQNIISDSVYYVTSIYYSDLDNDSDIDIVSVGWGGKVIWHENLGNGVFDTSINIINNTNSFYYGVVSFDVDNDGDNDVISTCNNGLIYYENQGNGSFGVPFTIYNGNFSSSDIEFKDLDNDGSLDVIVALTSSIVFYQNLGNGNFGSTQVLSSGHNSLSGLSINDLDGDGLNDVISIDANNSEVFWFKNLGGLNFSAKQIISLAFNRPVKVISDDVDCDGDIDLIVSDLSSTQVVWFENMGSGIFSNVEIISNFFYNHVTSLVTSDLDSDGDLDLVVGTYGDDKLAWHENYFISQFQIKGSFFYDDNQNKLIDSNDYGLPYLQAQLSPNGFFNYSWNNGNYSFAVDSGSYNVSYTPINNLWKLTTDSLTYSPVLTAINPIADSLNFGFYPDSIATIIEADLTGGFHRCNSTINYWINLKNLGTTNPSGIIHLELDSSVLYSGSLIAPDSINGNNLYWSYDSLLFFENKYINLSVNLPSVTFMGNEITSVLNIHEIVNNNYVYSISDTLSETLVCAYDPNDKKVIPEGLGNEGYIKSNYDLEYLVRFQNTGNDTAITVVIRDQLDDDLDWSSLEIISNSHPMQVSITPYGRADFKFENIWLPDSGANELASHGFVKFKIKQKQDLLPGTQIINGANIYFDFNPAIVTNTVINTIYDCDSVYLNINDTEFCKGDVISAFSDENFPYNNYFWTLDTTNISMSDSLNFITDSSGVFMLMLNVNNPICNKDSVMLITVNELPFVTLSSFDPNTICSNSNVIGLPIGSPSGGVYLGAGVNGGTFDPNIAGVGTHNIVYTYTDSNFCINSDSSTIIVQQIPTVILTNFNPDTICSTSNAATLPSGSPSGGVYSGTGVSGGTFDPNIAGVGTHSVIYTYTDTNSCINSDSTFITVEQCVGMDDLANDLGILIYPNPNTGLFTIEKSSELNKEVRVSLLDATSRVIIDKLILKGQQKVEMDITSYSKGIYYLQLTVGKEVFVKKILKN